jgi:hypothetical protein
MRRLSGTTSSVIRKHASIHIDDVVCRVNQIPLMSLAVPRVSAIAIDLCAGHQGFAAPGEPDVQIALIPVLLQLIHDLDQIVVNIGVTKILEKARQRLFLPAGERLITDHRKRVRRILDRASPG